MRIKIKKDFSNLFAIMACVLFTSCSGTQSSTEIAEKEMSSGEIDADGEWKLVSYRVGHETRVYGRDCDYMLSFDDEDMTFDFIANKDTIDGVYSVVDDTIRFSPDDIENENIDEVLKIVRDDDCYARQNDDSMVVILPDEREAVFTRKR